MPFIVRWPGAVKPGVTTDAMVSFTDLTPTFVELAGGKPAPGLDGRSFKNVVIGKTDPHELHNLAAKPEQGERIRALRTRLHEWLRHQFDEKALAALAALNSPK